jgi:drug/metabolite transporter (DMT)-like permease
LVFGAVIGEALFTIFRKATAHTVSPLLSSTLVTGFGLALFLPIGLIEAAAFDFGGASWQDYGNLIYSGVFVNVLAYILWFTAVGKVPASAAAAFTGVLPISAILLSAIILGERVTFPHLIGLGCVVVGIVFIARDT